VICSAIFPELVEREGLGHRQTSLPVSSVSHPPSYGKSAETPLVVASESLDNAKVMALRLTASPLLK
jgi:hypothetical protein